jgi:acylphosphatase
MSHNDVGAFIRVYGKVQGVGYRAFTQQVAERLGLKGYVKNLSDGSVEVYTEGPRNMVEAFIKELEKGPFLVVVEKVEVRWDTSTGKYDTFIILY